jgi:hypothetical protein
MSELAAFILVMVVLLSLGGGTAFVLARRRFSPLAADRKIGWPPYIERDRGSAFLGWAGSVLSVFVILAIATGFGWYVLAPTWKKVFDRYAERIDAMENRFHQISSLLPEPGSIRQTRIYGELNPLPIYDDGRKVFNTEIVSAAKLQAPDLRDDNDLYLREELSLLIYWRHNPPFNTDGKASQRLAQRFEQALACRYLVVYRFVPLPDELRQRTASKNPELLEVFLVDLQSVKRKAEFLVLTRDRSSAASDLLRELRVATGGTFVQGGL